MRNIKVLIAGGTGSWGHGLIQELLKENVQKIRVFARNEFQMVELMRHFGESKIEYIIGDVRDEKALTSACAGVDIVYHLAAIKHVPICEKMPYEAIETNVIGTKNIIDSAIKNNVDKVIYVSTDKAVNPDCTYGSTKLLGEKLILTANSNEVHTKFIVFRGGNLIGSTGSVIPLFEHQIEKKGMVTLTDERMNRFFISIKKASQLLIEITEKGAGGEIFVPCMPSLRIKDIARYMLSKYKLGESHITVTGIRPGEKINEELLSENEEKYLYSFTNDLFVIIQNDVHGWLANGIIEKTVGFSGKSDKSIIPYENAKEYLVEAGV